MQKTKYTGPIRIVDGTPVPYSGTVQQCSADGTWESVDASGLACHIADWLQVYHPAAALKKIEGAYFYY